MRTMLDDVTAVMAPDAVEISVFCDHCSARLTATGPTQADAHAKLLAQVADQRWRFVDRIAALDAGQPSTSHAPDLCCDCVAKL